MKIIYKQGDFLEGPERYKMHGCNAQGVMGSGAALAVKTKYPEAYLCYREHYLTYGLFVGCIVTWHGPEVSIINAITQEFYGRTSNRYFDYLAFEDIIRHLNWESGALDYVPEVAMPKIGAGLANGDWDIISKIIEEKSLHFQPVVYTL